MNVALRIIGVLLVLFALYVLVGEQMVGSSSEAYVNARLAAVRAPISGTVQVAGLAPGDRVDANQQIGNITSRRATTPRTGDLRQALALAEADQDAYALPEDQTGSAGASQSETELERRRADRRAAALRRLLDAQFEAQGTELSAALVAPAAGVVWSLESYPGQLAVEGEDLAHVLDCGSRFVHASVDRRLYNRLRVGDQAQFRPHAGGEPVAATVSLLAGTGPRELLDTFAIAPTETQLRGYTVLLEAPSLLGESCAVGRTGRVIFSAGPLQFLTVVADWLR